MSPFPAGNQEPSPERWLCRRYKAQPIGLETMRSGTLLICRQAPEVLVAHGNQTVVASHWQGVRKEALRGVRRTGKHNRGGGREGGREGGTEGGREGGRDGGRERERERERERGGKDKKGRHQT